MGQPIDEKVNQQSVLDNGLQADGAQPLQATGDADLHAQSGINSPAGMQNSADSGDVAKEPPQDATAPNITKQAEEYLHGWRRAKADYENLKKEIERERKEMGLFARSLTAMEFLPIYDNFKKAASHMPQLSESEESKRFKQWMDGIGHIQAQFKEVLKQMGIEEVATIGSQFDPRMHEAVEERGGEGAPTGQIIAEIAGGYKMGDKVLQAAKVIVAK